MTTWLQHVKKVHAAGSTSFKDSMKRASASWKKTKGGAAPKGPKGAKAPPKRRRKRKSKAAPEAEDSIDEPAPEPAEKPKKKRKKRAPRKIPAAAYKNVDSRNL